MGRSAITGGLVLGAMSVSWALSSLATGRIMLRTSYRFGAILGGASLVAGCVILSLLDPAYGPLPAAFGSLVIGIGMGICSTVFIVSIQASVPWGQRGAATSSSMFMRFVGQSIGASGCGAILNLTMRTLDPNALHAVERLLDAPTRQAMPHAELTHLTDVLSRSVQSAYALATTFALLALLMATRLPARLSPAHHTPRLRGLLRWTWDDPMDCRVPNDPHYVRIKTVEKPSATREALKVDQPVRHDS